MKCTQSGSDERKHSKDYIFNIIKLLSTSNTFDYNASLLTVSNGLHTLQNNNLTSETT